MYKVVLPLAVIIVLAGLFYLGVLVGKPLGAAKERQQRKAVDPALHDELGDLVLDLVAPTNIDDVLILPEDYRHRAAGLAGRVRASRRFAR